nr:MAG: DNA pilot protein [Microvirus sp.]
MIPIPIIVGGISLVSNLIGGLAEKRIARKNTNLTVRENQRLAELQYTREQENVKNMNLYNSPSSQMQRFRDAKLNPALIYSQGTPGNQTTIPKYSAPNLEYKYKAGFKGNEFDTAVGMAASAQQITNLIEVGKINKAEAIMKTALSGYAEDLAKSEAEISYNKWQKLKMERIFSEEEFNRFFQPKPNDPGYFQLRPGVEDTFTTWLASKYLAPSTEIEKSQASTRNIESQTRLNEKNLEFLNWGLPWAQPLINFLRLLPHK